MECPHCRTIQPQAAECARCGVVVAKYAGRGRVGHENHAAPHDDGLYAGPAAAVEVGAGTGGGPARPAWWMPALLGLVLVAAVAAGVAVAQFRSDQPAHKALDAAIEEVSAVTAGTPAELPKLEAAYARLIGLARSMTMGAELSPPEKRSILSRTIDEILAVDQRLRGEMGGQARAYKTQLLNAVAKDNPFVKTTEGSDVMLGAAFALDPSIVEQQAAGKASGAGTAKKGKEPAKSARPAKKRTR